MIRRERQPTHPGAFIKEMCLPEMNITVDEAANRLGVSRQMLHRLMQDENPASLTPETALGFEKVFGSTAETWLAMQNNYDLYRLRHDKIAS